MPASHTPPHRALVRKGSAEVSEPSPPTLEEAGGSYLCGSINSVMLGPEGVGVVSVSGVLQGRQISQSPLGSCSPTCHANKAEVG